MAYILVYKSEVDFELKLKSKDLVLNRKSVSKNDKTCQVKNSKRERRSKTFIVILTTAIENRITISEKCLQYHEYAY